jgi:hypothetical protein
LFMTPIPYYENVYSSKSEEHQREIEMKRYEKSLRRLFVK